MRQASVPGQSGRAALLADSLLSYAYGQEHANPSICRDF